MIFDRFYWVRKIERVMLPFPRFDQRDKHVKTITLGRVPLGGHQARDCFEGITIIALGLDWRDVHDCYLPKRFAHRSRRGAPGSRQSHNDDDPYPAPASTRCLFGLVF